MKSKKRRLLWIISLFIAIAIAIGGGVGSTVGREASALHIASQLSNSRLDASDSGFNGYGTVS